MPLTGLPWLSRILFFFWACIFFFLFPFFFLHPPPPPFFCCNEYLLLLFKIFPGSSNSCTTPKNQMCGIYHVALVIHVAMYYPITFVDRCLLEHILYMSFVLEEAERNNNNFKINYNIATTVQNSVNENNSCNFE